MQCRRLFIPSLLILSLAVFITNCYAYAATESILHSFNPYQHGRVPNGLIADAAGNLYGSTQQGAPSGSGLVFKLTPNGKGGWTETILYNFKGGDDGFDPIGKLTLDSTGNLYGVTTWSGGLNGVGEIFELIPSPKGEWTKKVLYNFSGNDGFNPNGGLIFDQAGNLYGTTVYGGGWTVNECSFDEGCGVVFKLTPQPQGEWKGSILYVFSGGLDGSYPNGDLIFDHAGNLYGTTHSGVTTKHGLVFELSPPSSGESWTETVLYTFTGGSDGDTPLSGVIFDSAGNLYGTTAGGGSGNGCNSFPCGTVFELASNSNDQWTETVLYSFLGGNDGQDPAGPTFDSAGNLYGTTSVGDYVTTCGTAWKLTPLTGGGWSESKLAGFPCGGNEESPVVRALPASVG